MIVRKMKLVVMAAVLAFTSSAAAADKDIVETAVAAGSFKTLAAALDAADLVGALQGKGPFTVFAPTDEAFAKLPKGTVETLLKPENKKKLAGILTYHVVSGKVPAADVVKLSGAKTLNGQQVDIKVAEGTVSVDTAKVVKTDIACSNGIIHVIDSVILPASDDIPTVASKAEGFDTLIAAVKAAGLAEALSGEGPFTVFAPTDAAFAKLPEGTVASLLKPENKAQLVAILKYHVVPGRIYSVDALKAGKANTLQGSSISIAADGEAAKVNDAKLVATDIDAANGVIHVIDRVILPPQKQAATPRQMIEQAIAKGAPLYNAGHKEQCAKIYMTAVNDMLALKGHGMCATTTHTLMTALNSAEHCQCPDTKSWTLRRAMDSAYASLR